MAYENFKTGFNKPTIITAQQYGTKISVELDHSDTDLDELMDAFQTLVIGLGYHDSAWKSWIVDRADEYKEEDIEDYVNRLSDKDIDKAFAEHNAHEEGQEFDDYGSIITKKKNKKK
jgi:hypothetical protein